MALTCTCPRCQLPAIRIGRAYAATSADGTHGVIGLCFRCTGFAEKFPTRVDRTLGKVIERALLDPARYGVKLFKDFNTAVLAVGLLGHPQYAQQALDALGWGEKQC